MYHNLLFSASNNANHAAITRYWRPSFGSDFSSNQLTYAPPDLFTLPALQSLYVIHLNSSNQIAIWPTNGYWHLCRRLENNALEMRLPDWITQTLLTLYVLRFPFFYWPFQIRPHQLFTNHLNTAVTLVSIVLKDLSPTGHWICYRVCMYLSSFQPINLHSLLIPKNWPLFVVQNSQQQQSEWRHPDQLAKPSPVSGARPVPAKQLRRPSSWSSCLVKATANVRYSFYSALKLMNMELTLWSCPCTWIEYAGFSRTTNSLEVFPPAMLSFKS